MVNYFLMIMEKHMKKIRLLQLACLSLLALFGVGVQSVLADSQASFSISPIISEHQTNGVTGFYDITWTPGQRDEFGVVITNHTDKAQTYIITLNKGQTNKNGIIDYEQSRTDQSKYQYDVTKLAYLPKEVTIAANSSETVKGSIVFPKDDYNGILLSGLEVSEKTSSGASKKNSSVSNVVIYNIPFILRGNIAKRPRADLKFIDLTVSQYSSDRYAANFKLENVNANLLKNVQVVSTILNKSGKIIETKKSEITITPETVFDYPIVLEKSYPAGKYVVKLVVTHGDSDKWTFNKSFAVTKAQYKQIKQLKKIGKTQLWKKFGLTAVIVFLMTFVWWLSRKKRKEQI